jgi:hypothetical protein
MALASSWMHVAYAVATDSPLALVIAMAMFWMPSEFVVAPVILIRMVTAFVTPSQVVQMPKLVTMMKTPLRTMVLVSMLMLVESAEDLEFPLVLAIALAMSWTSAAFVEAWALRKVPVTVLEPCQRPITIAMATV